MESQAHADQAAYRAGLEAIRMAAMHGTELVTQLNGQSVVLSPQDHPLYREAFANTNWVPRSELNPATAKLKT